MATSIAKNFWAKPCFALPNEYRQYSRFQFGCLASRDSSLLTSESAKVNGSIPAKEKKSSIQVDVEDGRLRSIFKDTKREEDSLSPEKLEPLWDDGYGTQSVKDYLDSAKEMIKPDGGPPRWFTSVSCGPPLNDSPVLLFLPGMDGIGLGLTLHHKALGKVFEVWCMHIPVYDRTPFEGLVKFVEQTLRSMHASSPNKPIYLVGDSFGGCLALAVAARNPSIDLVMILANPATSFGRSQLQPLLPLLEALPEELHFSVPYLLSFVMGDPMKMATVEVEASLPPGIALEQLAHNLTGLLPRLSGLADIIPKETLLWKLKLLNSAATYANSRLHAVRAEVLVLASGKDNMLPSGEEAHRLTNLLKNCQMRYFKDNGHTILLEDGVNLLTIIKATCKYRRSQTHDFVRDFVPPSRSEFKLTLQNIGWYMNFTCPVMLSTMEDGRLVRGLAGVPSEGPVLLVGYHMLMGLELTPLIAEFLREKNIMVRGIAHPSLFSRLIESENKELSFFDNLKVYGALPVTASNLFKLFASRSHVLLYPGGAREALHYKGEEYKLFWPDQPEFVRMAARFGATIVPFGAVGEDDLAELALDYNDLTKIPVLNERIRRENELAARVRDEASGEVANQALFIPGLLPKVPGRLYYLFGKPVKTQGKQELLKDKDKARELYLQIKSEIENNMSYLLKKREKDPYRNVIDRTIYRAFSVPVDQVPAFDP